MTHSTWQFRRGCQVVCGAGLAVAILGLLQSAFAASFGPDPVDELRRVLSIRIEKTDPVSPADSKARRENLEKAVAKLRLSDLRRALSLLEWQDEDRIEAIAIIDRPIRGGLIDRFHTGLQALLKDNRSSGKLAALSALGEMGLDIRGTDPHTPLIRDLKLTDEIIALTKDPDPAVREQAALTLGRVFPTQDSAAKVTAALAEQLKSDSVGPRRAAAAALGKLLRVFIDRQNEELSSISVPVNLKAETDKGGTKVKLDIAPDENAEMARLVLDSVEPGLHDSDPDVRRLGLESVRSAAAILAFKALLPIESSSLPAEGALTPDERQAKLLGLTSALTQRVPDVTTILSDREPSIRLSAAQTIQEIAGARQRLVRLVTPVPTPGVGGRGDLPTRLPAVPTRNTVPYRTVGFQKPPADKGAPEKAAPEKAAPDKAPEPPARDAGDNAKKAAALRKLVGEGIGLSEALPVLARRLTDSDVDVRLMALEAIELMEKDAAPVAPALLNAFNDRSPFVRWGAARTLSRIGTSNLNLKEVVPALTGLLNDTDLDVRRGSINALISFGPAAVDAIPALNRQTGRGDPEIRLDAIHAIQAINRPTPDSVTALASALGNEDDRVRRAAAHALGQFGPSARSASPALRKALNDTEPDVRKAVSDALLSVTTE